ncbi:hypothetical protein [Paenibacillus sp. OV219]|uniref:hypothetical protein n=1 Tax=Paenibacillus sp. OV219 TaxID=1884377 RepID=UPI0008BB5ED4|nr:hypothetical protein [Paenibacillus sp. OV219]SEO55910.1 hypothetical protein SAMN05518847_108249 [Paenibacillus sp. OV219]
MAYTSTKEGCPLSKLLDARTSQNASNGNSINIELLADTPTMIGVVGLIVTGASGIIRVQLSGIAAIDIPEKLPEEKVVALGAIRGTLPTDPIIGYTRYEFSRAESGVKILHLTASDYNVPFPASHELVYSLFLFSSEGCTRIGPESFNASAFSD